MLRIQTQPTQQPRRRLESLLLPDALEFPVKLEDSGAWPCDFLAGAVAEDGDTGRPTSTGSAVYSNGVY